MSQEAIGILFGVKGGSSIDVESGHLIQSQLAEIASQINLQVNIDQQYFSSQTAKLKEEIEKQLGTLKVNIQTNTQTGGSSNSGSGGKGSAGGVSHEAQAYKQLRETLSECRSLSKSFYSDTHEDTEAQAEMLSQLVRKENELSEAITRAKADGSVSDEHIAEIERLRAKTHEAATEISALTSAKQRDAKTASDSSEAASREIQAYKQLKETLAEYSKLSKDFHSDAKQDTAVHSEKLSQLTQKENELGEAIARAKADGSVSEEHIAEINRLRQKTDEAATGMDALIAAKRKDEKTSKEATEAKRNEAEAYDKLKEKLAEYEKLLKAVKTDLRTGGEFGSEEHKWLENQLFNAKSALDQAKKDASAKGVAKEQIEEIERLEDKVNDATASFEALAEARRKDKLLSMETKNKGLMANASQLLNNNVKLIKSNKEAKKVAEELQKVMNEPFKGKGYEAAVKHNRDLANAVKTASAAFSDIDRKTNTIGRKLKETFQSKVLQTFAYTLIGIATRALSQVYGNVVKINTAMTQLRIVTNESEKAYSDYADTIAAASQRIGSSISSLIDSTTVFARLGYSLKDAAAFAEKATSYSNVSGVEIGTATTNITAIVKAFNVGANDLEGVLDRMIYVGNNFAISSGEIGEGMNNAASALSANGNTLDEAIGILTAANVTIQNASRSSTAVRTIAARMSQSKEDLEELGENSDELLATSALDEKMRSFGVAVTDANGNLRSTYDVLNDLSKVWGTLENTEQAAIADMLAGNRQQNAFYSIMQNWKDAQKVVAESASANGSLADAQAEYVNSIQGKMNQLTASWEDFSTTILNSDIVVFFVDVLKVVANALTAISSFGDGVIPVTVAVGVAMYALGLAIRKAFNGGITSWSTFVAAIQSGCASIGAALKTLAQNPYMYMTLLVTLFIQFSDKLPRMAKSIVAYLLLIAGGVVLACSTSKKAIDMFMSSNFVGWILLAITAIVSGISLLSKSLASVIHASTEAKNKAVEAAEKSKEAWEDAEKSLDELTGKLESAKDKFSELQRLANEGTITLVEKDEMDKLKCTIADLETEQKLLENTAKIKQEKAEKDAANAVRKISQEDAIDANSDDKIPRWVSYVRLFVKPKDSRQYADDILGDWENATEKQKDHVIEFFDELQVQKEALTYHSGENLQQWQLDANEAYNTYYEYLHKISIAQGNFDTVWDSTLSMERFDGVQKLLTDWANSGSFNTYSVDWLYDTNTQFASFVDYLEQIGMLSLDDEDSLRSFVNQVNSLADAAKSVDSKSYLDILNEVQEKFDKLNDALESIEKNGIVSADSIGELIEKYPSLLKYLKMTDQGYVLFDAYEGMSTYDILNDYATGYLQDYVDELARCEEGTENYDKAQANLNNAISVMATLLRSQAIKDATSELEKSKDAIEKQKDNFKDLIEIRKDLLKTYKDEVDYQKELAKRQKTVSDLRTQLAVATLDTSASGQAKVRELQEKLSDAEEDLDDYTLEHAIDVLTNQIDSEYDEYEKFIKSEVDRIEEAIKGLKDTIHPEPVLPESTVQYDGKSHAKKAAQDYIVSHGMLESDKMRWGQDKNFLPLLRAYVNMGGNLDDLQGKEKHSPWISYQDAAKSGYSNIRTPSEFSRGDNNDKKTYKTYQAYLDAMYRKYVGTYHAGGLVDDIALAKENEVFAKLMRGEFVSTPAQMQKFMGNTLPSIANYSPSTGGNEFNAPLIEIHCDTITNETLPAFKEIVNNAVQEVKRQLDNGMSRTGYKRALKPV